MKYKNNPLNIRHSSKFTWNGEVSHFNGFCVFSSQWSCYRAALIILSNYKKRGLVSIHDIISTWAPSSENPTENYISFISNQLPMPSDISIYNTDIAVVRVLTWLLYYMSIFEQGPKFHPNYDIISDCVTKHIKLFS